jgi:hypothetical protein
MKKTIRNIGSIFAIPGYEGTAGQVLKHENLFQSKTHLQVNKIMCRIRKKYLKPEQKHSMSDLMLRVDSQTSFFERNENIGFC